MAGRRLFRPHKKEKFVEVTKALVDTTFSCRSGPTPALLSPLPSAVLFRGCVIGHGRSHIHDPASCYILRWLARLLVGPESVRPPPGGGGLSPRARSKMLDLACGALYLLSLGWQLLASLSASPLLAVVGEPVAWLHRLSLLRSHPLSLLERHVLLITY